MDRILLVAVLFCVVSRPSIAQGLDAAGQVDPVSKVEVGAMVGTFSGISLKYQRPSGTAWDLHSSFSANGFFGALVHVLRESAVENSPLTFFIGPGVTGGTSDSEVFLGPAAEAGVFFSIEHYRIVLQLMPEIEVVPRLEGRLLAGVGLRISL